MYDALASACKSRVSLLGGSHCQFAEYNFTCSLGEGSCPSPTITRDEQHGLTIDLMVPWLRHALQDDVWGWLEFESLLTSLPEVTSEISCSPTSVVESWDDAGPVAPIVSLAPARPNPFRSQTTLRYFVAEPCHAEVQVFSLSGRLVATLADEHASPGWHTARWDGRDRGGARVASGVYACLVTACGESDGLAIALVR
jgi:hypothetical protein